VCVCRALGDPCGERILGGGVEGQPFPLGDDCTPPPAPPAPLPAVPVSPLYSSTQPLTRGSYHWLCTVPSAEVDR
jgi:hypothetical protein